MFNLGIYHCHAININYIFGVHFKTLAAHYIFNDIQPGCYGVVFLSGCSICLVWCVFALHLHCSFSQIIQQLFMTNYLVEVLCQMKYGRTDLIILATLSLYQEVPWLSNVFLFLSVWLNNILWQWQFKWRKLALCIWIMLVGHSKMISRGMDGISDRNVTFN